MTQESSWKRDWRCNIEHWMITLAFGTMSFNNVVTSSTEWRSALAVGWLMLKGTITQSLSSRTVSLCRVQRRCSRLIVRWVTDREEAAQNNKHLKRKVLKEKIKRVGVAVSSQIIQTNIVKWKFRMDIRLTTRLGNRSLFSYIWLNISLSLL